MWHFPAYFIMQRYEDTVCHFERRAGVLVWLHENAACLMKGRLDL
jgi:hypothetical protein